MYTLIGHTDIEAGEERAMAPLKRVLCAWCICYFVSRSLRRFVSMRAQRAALSEDRELSVPVDRENGISRMVSGREP